jgi:hypothetical protein
MKYFLLSVSTKDLEFTYPPKQWVAGVLSPGMKWPGCKPDHSLAFSADVENAWSFVSTSLHNIIWFLFKQRNSFALILVIAVLSQYFKPGVHKCSKNLGSTSEF